MRKKIAKYIIHVGLFYVLDYSGSFDVHIEKWSKNIYFFRVCNKNGFYPMGDSELQYNLYLYYILRVISLWSLRSVN